MPLDLSARRALAAAALKTAADKPWRDVTVFDFAAAMNAPIEDIAGTTVGDAVDAIEEWLDAEAAKGLRGVDWVATPRDRLFDVVMRRFEAMETVRGGLRAIEIALERDPAAVAQQHLRAVRSARWLLSLAGIDADGVAGVARAQGLAVILAQVRMAWRQDDAGDFVKTMAALDKALRRAEQTFGRFGGFEPPRPEPPAAEPPPAAA
ncbi:MAG: TetR/AcrR family transcriptional regulator [Alphaproteobacteria bacterium]|nr:TetR/AcrR family transcriptional regulator [Alphaproteobacteria bacterium]